MAGSFDELELRSRNACGEGAAVFGRDDAVARAPHDESRHLDAVEPPREVGIVEMRLPRIQAERIPSPREEHQLVVGVRLQVALPAQTMWAARSPLGVMPRAPFKLRGWCVEQV